MYLKIRPRIFQALRGLAVLVVFVGGGAALLHWSEGHDWLDSWYWSLTTLSTTGYGPSAPPVAQRTSHASTPSFGGIGSP